MQDKSYVVIKRLEAQFQGPPARPPVDPPLIKGRIQKPVKHLRQSFLWD